MKLTNIHCHMLYGVDDGAKDGKVMRQMIDAAYAGGVRVICMTPHYNPQYFRCHLGRIIEHFGEAREYAAEKYRDLTLLLGQEIYYHHDSVEDLLTGKCLSLNKTRNVLVEFGPYDDRSAIFAGAGKLLTSGFIPVIAHVERYSALRGKKHDIDELRSMGALIQINAASVLGKRGFAVKHYVMSLIKYGLADIVADDCHDTAEKAPCLGAAYEVVARKFGEDEAVRLFVKNPLDILKRPPADRGGAGKVQING